VSTIDFTTKLLKIGPFYLVLLPKEASAQLPSRGMALVEGTINDFHFKTALEPDGRGSHWLKVDKVMHQAIGVDEGGLVSLAIQSSKDWPEPEVPEDIAAALQKDAEAAALWHAGTPMARWDWIRWIRATNNEETRKHHIEVALSKLKNGLKRPCCFNRSMCTEPLVSKSGVLLLP